MERNKFLVDIKKNCHAHGNLGSDKEEARYIKEILMDAYETGDDSAIEVKPLGMILDQALKDEEEFEKLKAVEFGKLVKEEEEEDEEEAKKKS